ncbi:hypothetical protein DY000_02013496 [Brassica cretica]|uniref:Uncharacterized protein n=1 Tax=Brassica cretica TaxID=69181 RepID=A0ABQ7D093_BRACR|nr:hypothetical protein DY000_02013496 [Brassica cretica]
MPANLRRVSTPSIEGANAQYITQFNKSHIFTTVKIGEWNVGGSVLLGRFFTGGVLPAFHLASTFREEALSCDRGRWQVEKHRTDL